MSQFCKENMFIRIALMFLLCVINHAHVIKEDIKWTLHNNNGSINVGAHVPGGVYSDLMRERIIGDVLYRFNDVLTRWVAHDTWTYQGRFNVTEEQLKHNAAYLVLHGADTISFIELNGSPIGQTNNMFVKYTFDVKRYLNPGENELKVIFTSPIEAANKRSEKEYTVPDCVPKTYNGECHANQLRKMQASFGWDWGPAFPSVGLWKPVTLGFYDNAIITTVSTHTKKIDQHWHLKIETYLEANTKEDIWNGILQADLIVEGHQTITMAKEVEAIIKTDGSAKVELNMTISENVIRLWWPNGYGDQNLYDLRVSLRSTNLGSEYDFKTLRIGFRSIEVVEENASITLGNDTEAGKGLTFYFKVNGYPIFMKGSNWIPANILPELGTDKDTVDNLLLSARDTHMNMIRVWGGGVYESEHFYRRCDELGILIWQDFLFACSMYPVDTEFINIVRTEIEQNVKRLQHHPSIALWAGNNENEAALIGNWYNTYQQFDKYKEEYIKLYVDTIWPIVEDLDPSRRYLVSSPSNGVESEKEGYVASNPYDPYYGDTHYYNYFTDGWNANGYPKTRFASEYGFQSLPSLATMSTATQNTTDYSLNSEYSKHRQHLPMGNDYLRSQVAQHFHLNGESFNLTSGEDINDKDFEKFVYLSQIEQAMAVKTETEFYRQSQSDWLTMGALYWQLNDVWQAPSWSGIEYGGKWKMLHYFAKKFFAPVLVSPRLLLTGDVEVYLINDRFVPIIECQILVDTFRFNNLTPSNREVFNANIKPLSAVKLNIHISTKNNANMSQEPLRDHNGALAEATYENETFLRFSLKAKGVPDSPYNYVFPVPFKNLKSLITSNIKISVSHEQTRRGWRNGRRAEAGPPFTYLVNIRADTVVLFLWLESTLEGRFTDNGLIVTQPFSNVKFVSKTLISAGDLARSISYKYYLN